MSDPRFVGPIDRLLFLRTLPEVQGLDGPELTLMAREAEEVYLRKGDVVLREGEPVERFHLVVSGEIAVASRGRVIVHCRAGDNVGFLPAVVNTEPRYAAHATTDTVALAFDAEMVIAAMDENFGFYQNMLRNAAAYHLSIMPQVVGGTRRAPWVGEGLTVPDRPLDIVERLVLLRRGNIFRNLGLEALVLMATSMRQERWKAGTELWMPGDHADHLLVILDGEAVCHMTDGQTFEAGRGYPLGNLETLARQERWYRPVAQTDMITLRGNHEALFDVLEDDFDVAMEFFSSVAEGAMTALERLAELRGPVSASEMGHRPMT